MLFKAWRREGVPSLCLRPSVPIAFLAYTPVISKNLAWPRCHYHSTQEEEPLCIIHWSNITVVLGQARDAGWNKQCFRQMTWKRVRKGASNPKSSPSTQTHINTPQVLWRIQYCAEIGLFGLWLSVCFPAEQLIPRNYSWHFKGSLSQFRLLNECILPGSKPYWVKRGKNGKAGRLIYET